jgi:hypothetical protein
MSNPIPTRSEYALAMLARAAALYKNDMFTFGDAMILHNELTVMRRRFERGRDHFLRLHAESAYINESPVDRSLNDACELALGDFYLQCAQRVVETRRQSSHESREVAQRRITVPSLYEIIVARIERSGFEVDAADLETPLNVAGLQLLALLLEGETWPVLVIDGDTVPVVGRQQEQHRRVSPEVLVRMREEAQRIGRASNAIIEQREPAVTMAGVINTLATWLPFRIRQETPPAAGGGSAVGGNAGNHATLLGRADGGYDTSLLATSVAGGYSPNFGVDTTNPDCSIASSVALVVCFSHFGGPKTPVRRYLNSGNYLFEATASDGSTYLTPHKVKVPDCDPLMLPFP